MRISVTWSAGRTASPSARTASMAASACARGTRYSDWISSPTLGVKPIWKCGSRSDQRPGTPCWRVQWTGSRPGIGCRSPVAGRAPNSSSRGEPARDLTHTEAVSSQRVNTLTLSPAARDLVEVLEQRVPRQALVDALGDLVGGLDVERDARDDSERAQADHETVEVRVAARRGEDLAVRGHQLEPGDRGGEVAGRVAGPVGGGGDRAGHGDVRQRGQVVQRDSLGVQGLGQLAIADGSRRR